MIANPCQLLYEQVADRVRRREVFGDVQPTDKSLGCQVKDVESQAFYMVELSDTRDVVWVGLYTEDRWLSESIEADLMHSGDKIEELLAEELCEQGLEISLPVEHFRDEQKQYVFRSPFTLAGDQGLESAPTFDAVAAVLLAYEACFGQLGELGRADE
jgi:hypothetical protein